MIDIANDQAARQPALRMRLDEQALHAVELRAIGQLRQRIADRFFVQRLAALFQRCFRRGVVQQQRDAVQRAVGRGDGDDVSIDRNVVIVAAADDQPQPRLHAGLQRMGDGAFGVAEALAVSIAHLQQARREMALQNAGRVDSRQSFGAAIPERDLQIAVEKRHAVVHVVQQLLLKQILFRRQIESRPRASTAANWRRPRRDRAIAASERPSAGASRFMSCSCRSAKQATSRGSNCVPAADNNSLTARSCDSAGR